MENVRYRNGEYYWIKDVRGGKWEPARYRAAYMAGDGHEVPERWVGTNGDADVAEVGHKVIGPDKPICELRFAVQAREELRDRFAMAALPAILSDSSIQKSKEDRLMVLFPVVAESAYEVADAMMETRNK